MLTAWAITIVLAALTIAIHYDKVNPEIHSAQILADLQRLQSN